MDARGTCDGRHRARKNCPDPECYLREELLEATPTELPPITDADNLAGELPWRPEEHEDAALDALPMTPDRGQRVSDDDPREELAIMERLAQEPIEFGPGIYRWVCSRPGGYQRTEYAHELPPCPAGWRWSSAQVTAVGGRGKLHVSAAVVDGSEGANAPTGPQSLVLEITGRGGYCTGLDVVLFARPSEVRR